MFLSIFDCILDGDDHFRVDVHLKPPEMHARTVYDKLSITAFCKNVQYLPLKSSRLKAAVNQSCFM